MIYIGSTIYSDQKLMYFPTQQYETYRLLAILGDLQLDYIKERYIREYSVIPKEEYNELFIYSVSTYAYFSLVLIPTAISTS